MSNPTTTLTLLQPDQIERHPDNARKDFGDLAGLQASIAKLGVLVPIIVTTNGNGKYRLVAGERRWMAATKVGVTLPAIIREELHDVPLDQALAMLAENESRQNLNTAEAAAAYQHAFDLGATDDELHQATGADVTFLGQARKVAGSKVATAVAAKYDITLEQAAALAEFEDDKDTVKHLTEIAINRPFQWDHQLAGARAERKEQQKLAGKLQPYLDAGVRVLTDNDLRHTPLGYRTAVSPESPRKMIRELLTAKGKRLTPAGHKGCPGRSVAICRPTGWGDREVVEFCEDPTGNGHKKPSKQTQSEARSGKPTPTDSKEEQKRKEAESAERKKVLANNKALSVAQEVRRAFVAKLLKQTTIPKGTPAFITEQLVEDNYLPQVSQLDTFPSVLGDKVTLSAYVNRLPATRVIMGALAYCVLAVEETMDKTSWRTPTPTTARYLRFLMANGYTPADVEQLILKGKGK